MAKHKPTAKISRQTALQGTDTPEIKKFKNVFGPVRDARLALLALSRPHLIKVPDMTSQEAQTLAKKLGLDNSEEKRCKNTPSRLLSFIHLKCRTTVFCLYAE